MPTSTPTKQRRKPSWFRIAKRWWPRAYRIEGNGPFAVVAACRPGVVIVSLYETEEEAITKLQWIDTKGCGGRCRLRIGWHELFDLRDAQIQWPPPDHGYPAACDEPRGSQPQPSHQGGSMQPYVISTGDLLKRLQGGAQ